MKRLLIVDDEPEIIEGLIDILKEIDHIQLDTAHLADEALRKLENASFDMILADIHMPGMDGLEMCELIQTHWPDTRIIFLSGVRDFNIIYRSIQNPTVRYLTKMEPDHKIRQTILEVCEEIDTRERQKRLQELMARTFPQAVINELGKEQANQDSAQKIRGYIQAHLDQDLSLPTLGHLVNFNPNYLSRLFKEQTGTTLSDYVIKLRMSTAREHLLHSNKKIHEIARMVGYDSAHSFIRAFRKQYGMSPADYRAIHTEK